MEEVRRVLRPWPERMTASAPLLIPALSLLCACAAMDVSLWFWIPCFCLASLPCFYVRPPWGCLPLPWRCGPPYIFSRMNGNTQAFPWKRGESWLWKAPLRLFRKSVLFRPDGSRWLYAVSSRDGACPLEAGERYRIRGEAYPLQAPCGPGIFDRERWGYLHGIIAGIRLDEYCRNGPGDWRSRFRAFPCGSGKGLPPCSGRAPLRMMRPGR